MLLVKMAVTTERQGRDVAEEEEKKNDAVDGDDDGEGEKAAGTVRVVMKLSIGVEKMLMKMMISFIKEEEKWQ